MLYISLSILGIVGLSIWLIRKITNFTKAIKLKKWRANIKLGDICYKKGAAKEGGIFGTVITIGICDVLIQTRLGIFVKVLISDLCPIKAEQLDEKKLAKIKYYLYDYNI